MAHTAIYTVICIVHISYECVHSLVVSCLYVISTCINTVRFRPLSTRVLCALELRAVTRRIVARVQLHIYLTGIYSQIAQLQSCIIMYIALCMHDSIW